MGPNPQPPRNDPDYSCAAARYRLPQTRTLPPPETDDILKMRIISNENGTGLQSMGRDPNIIDRQGSAGFF